MAIFQALLEVQKGIDVIPKNDSGYNYKYANSSTVLGTIRPLLNKHGLILKQEAISIVTDRIETTNKKGDPKLEMLCTVSFRFTWVHAETGETDENLFITMGCNDLDKGVGSAHTYAERYFLLKYFHIPTDADDPDAQGQRSYAKKTTPTAQPRSTTPKAPIDTKPSPKQVNYLTTLMKQKEYDHAAFHKIYPDIDKLDKFKVSEAIQGLYQKPDRTKEEAPPEVDPLADVPFDGE